MTHFISLRKVHILQLIVVSNDTYDLRTIRQIQLLQCIFFAVQEQQFRISAQIQGCQFIICNIQFAEISEILDTAQILNALFVQIDLNDIIHLLLSQESILILIDPGTGDIALKYRIRKCFTDLHIIGSTGADRYRQQQGACETGRTQS